MIMYDNNLKNELMESYNEEILYDKVYVNFLSDRDITILTNIGLPNSISPYISIQSTDKYGGHSLYERINDFEKYDKEEQSLKDLCFIGLVDYGYVVIDKVGKIQIFDYEREALRYVNSSLDIFLDCAYEYMKFMKTVNDKYGEDGFFEGLYTEEDIEELKHKISELDEEALDSGFWDEQIEFLYEDMNS